MQPKNFQFGGGAVGTILHPAVAIGMLVAIILILVLPRKKVIIPFFLAFFTIPFAQVLVLGGVHFTMHQILILTVLARSASFRGSGGKFPGGYNGIDSIAVLWALSTLITSNLEWMETQALIKTLGDLVINLGGYLAARFLIPDREAVRRTIKLLALICLIHGACMIVEQLTLRNVFAFAGASWPEIRNGHIRAAGVMGAGFEGTFSGVLIPLFFWLWKEKKFRLAACAGLVGATAVVWASYNSTSWMACGAGLLGLCFWPLRKQMRLVRWGLVATLLGLHLVMHGPVWSLIEKIDVTGGSSSYHRYQLVDQCIRHFGDWWLLGYKNYGSWGWDMYDLCDQWVAVAVTGGLVTFMLFIMIYSRSFGAIGNARKHAGGDRRQEWLFWCLGSALFAAAIASFGVNFTIFLLLLFFQLLVCILASTQEAKQPAQTKVKTHDGSHLAPVVELLEA